MIIKDSDAGDDGLCIYLDIAISVCRKLTVLAQCI